MDKIRYTEIFGPVFQGEARYTGVPSVFLRTFGCNFRCKNFNRDPNEIIDGPNPEVKEIIQNIDRYKSLDDLPLVHSGCDSFPSVYPEFKGFAHNKTIDEIATDLISELPNNEWNDTHLVITGGEPLLWQKQLKSLLNHELLNDLRELTFETNGTQWLNHEFTSFLYNWSNSNNRTSLNLTFSVSPKLRASGEQRDKAIIPEIIYQYQQYGYTYLKFVVGNESDVDEVKEVVKLYKDAGFTGSVYLMPVGGTIETYNQHKRLIADLALKNGFRFSDRLHIDLYGNSWGT